MKKFVTNIPHISYKIESVFVKDVIAEIRGILADPDIDKSGQKEYFTAMLEALECEITE